MPLPPHMMRRNRPKPGVDRNAAVYRDLKAKPAPAPAAVKPEPAPAPVPAPAPAPEPVVEAAPAKPELSMSNTKAELLAAAESLGLSVDGSNTKAEILAAIEAA